MNQNCNRVNKFYVELDYNVFLNGCDIDKILHSSKQLFSQRLQQLKWTTDDVL